MAFDGESHDGSEIYSDAGGDPSGYRAALERVKALREESPDENHMVSIKLSAYEWANILEALEHLAQVVGFFNRDTAADCWEAVASQLAGRPLKLNRPWKITAKKEKPIRKKILGIF